MSAWPRSKPLIACYRRHRLPWAILADNDPSWGIKGTADWTQLGVWLLRLGIELWHGAPYHPQAQGKVERIHRTIAADVFGGQIFPDMEQTQSAFTAFRHAYNHYRPHAALDHALPATRYRMNERPYPVTVYADDAQIRIIGYNGMISFRGRRIQTGEAFREVPVAITATAVDGQLGCSVATRRSADWICVASPRLSRGVTYVPERLLPISPVCTLTIGHSSLLWVPSCVSRAQVASCLEFSQGRVRVGPDRGWS